jgi:prevent-host-death family protein
MSIIPMMPTMRMVLPNLAPKVTAAGGSTMRRLNVVELRRTLAEVLNRAEYQGERIVIHRRSKDATAIISIEDLRLLERLIEDAEDRLDVRAARAALAESDERIPYAEVRRRLGLVDEQETPPARTRAEVKARAKTI